MPAPAPRYGHMRKAYYRNGIVEGSPPGPGEEGSSLLDHDMPTQRTTQPLRAYSPREHGEDEALPSLLCPSSTTGLWP